MEPKSARNRTEVELQCSSAGSGISKLEHELRDALAGIVLGCEALAVAGELGQVCDLSACLQRQASLLSSKMEVLLHVSKSNAARLTWWQDSFDEMLADFGSDDDLAVASTLAEFEPQALRILAIDDREDVLLPFRILLTGEGHDFSEAKDSVAGLEMALAFRPDIIFCDVELGDGGSGLDLARRVRADDRLRDVFLVAMSGYSAVERVQESIDAGFDHYLVKPVGLKTLRKVIANRSVLESRLV